MRRRRKIVLLSALPLLAGAAALGLRSAEGIALCGSTDAKVSLCRAVSHLSDLRRCFILARLLRDSAAEVRSAAVTAWGKSGRPAKLGDIVRSFLEDENSAPELRNKAGLALLAHPAPDNRALAYIQGQSRSRAFRAACAILVARAAELSLPGMREDERRALLAEALSENDPAHEALQEMVRRQAAAFRFREELLQRLAQPAKPATRQFILACLAEIDGAMRGHRPEDWESVVYGEAEPDSFQAVEAEWATEIKPNYHIGEHKGVGCLMLGEGASGYMGWLKGP